MFRRIGQALFCHVFQRTTCVVVACTAFLCGIGLARTGQIVDGWLVGSTTLLALIVLRKRDIGTIVLLALCCCLFGWWRGGVYLQRVNGWQSLYGQRVVLAGRATTDGVYNSRSAYSFTLNKVSISGRPLTGEVSISGFGVSTVYRGDDIVAQGKLRPGFGSTQASMGFAQLEVVGHHPTIIDTIRQKFAAGMQSALPEPLASFGLGLLIGQRNTLPKGISQQLLAVGLTHIIAVSGYNVMILLRAAKRGLRRGSKFQITAVSTALVGIFLLFTGSSPSIVRAAIVSMLSIAAWYYGRTIKPLVLILVAAVITGWAKPLYVWGDTSWYLSFLSFYGVLVLAPLICARLPKRLANSALGIVAIESLCAELMTLPFVLHTFGQLALIGVIANILVVTLVPLAMLLALVAGLSGMLLAPVAGWLAWPANLLLTYMLDVAGLLSRLPHTFLQKINFSVLTMLATYVLIVSLSGSLWYATSRLARRDAKT